MHPTIDRSTVVVVVAVDETPGSLAALRWAHGHAAAHGLELVAVQAWQYPALASLLRLQPLPSPDEVDEAVLEALDAAVAGALGDASGRVRTVAARGPAGAALVARSERAALLVVGRTGEGDGGSWLGSVSRRVLEEAACPVAVVPPSWEPGDRGDIVVGVDFSDAARAPLRWAALEAQTTGQRLVALHALAPKDVVADVDAARADAEQQLRDRCEAFGHEGARWATRISERVPPSAVEEAAVAPATDLVVLGRRGAGLLDLDKRLLGSVASYAARYAVQPVVVVPPAWHA